MLLLFLSLFACILHSLRYANKHFKLVLWVFRLRFLLEIFVFDQTNNFGQQFENAKERHSKKYAESPTYGSKFVWEGSLNICCVNNGSSWLEIHTVKRYIGNGFQFICDFET